MVDGGGHAEDYPHDRRQRPKRHKNQAMGSNLALNIAEKGHRIAVFNRTTAQDDRVRRRGRRRSPTDRALRDDRGARRGDPAAAPVIIMVQAGAAGRRADRGAACRCCRGDIIIDAGNANFRDTAAASPNLKAPA
jgi:6-phosphogluconate dehydrogenase